MRLAPLVWLAVLSSDALAIAPAAADQGVERYVLVVGANVADAGRPPLRYAVSDAERFVRVLVELGGVRPADAILLKQPKLKELTEALDGVRARVARRAAAGGRSEVLVYYSGHADEKGLLLGDDRYSYRTLRDRLDEMPADVRIAVLDACASGAITRLKGGRLRPPFLVDESSAMRGHAFVTSSAETEVAQESDRLGASYFSHYLISGLRGAADTSGDGKVTLNEAYQFAFNETLGRTVDTKGGAQHPSYDINLSGSGDVVMTDLRETSATLVLGEGMDGRFFVRNAAQELVVELYKPLGRQVDLGLAPGKYEVRVEREPAALVATADVAEGGRVVLVLDQFRPTTPERTRRRGGLGPSFPVGRERVAIRFGMGLLDPVPGFGTSAAHVARMGEKRVPLGGIRYARYVRDGLALTFGIDVTTESREIPGSPGVFKVTTDAVSVPVGVQWTPVRAWAAPGRRAKPHLLLATGPVFASMTSRPVPDDPQWMHIPDPALVQTAIGVRVGAGLDVRLGHRIALGLQSGYGRTSKFDVVRGGARRNYNGFDVALSVGWSFGRGSNPRH